MHKHLRRVLVTAGLAAAGAVPLLALGGFAAAQSTTTPTSTATGSATASATSTASATATASATSTATATATTTATATATATTTATPSGVTLKAGGGEPGYSVELFLPDKVTVQTGTTVTWVNTFEEPHTVTFGNPAGDPTTPIGVTPGQPVQYDGTQSFSSGLFAPGYPPGPPGTPASGTSFSVTFTKAGNFNYFCAIHPNMKGEVDVVDSGAVDSQSDIDAAGASAYAAALASLKADNAQQQTAPIVTTNADGTKTYTLDVGGNDNLNGSLMQFYPPSVDVAVNDTVFWKTVTHTPHTVTFRPDLFQGDPFGPASVPAGAYDGSALANSGIIEADTPAASFSMKFGKAGTFQYVCLLHASEGMTGTVNVSKATGGGSNNGGGSTTTAPKAPNTGTGVSSSNGGATLWISLGILAALFAVSGAGVVAVKRHN